VWLLVDQSASSAQASAVPGISVLELSTRAAAEIAAGLVRAGIDCAIASFASVGRSAVTVQLAKRFDDALDSMARSRLSALRPGGSTRLGAALRHATLRLRGRHAERRELILLSDAQAHDIDVHDPRYLLDDAQRAVQAAARQGVRIRCLRVGADRDVPALRLFGAGASIGLHGIDALPRALRRLLR
jgi:nitric oxide reductase activation protein